MTSKNKITSNLKIFLKDFSQKYSEDLLFANRSYKHSLSGDYDKCRLIRYIFAEILSFKVSDQPMEKVNWWIPFSYKNKYECAASHQKFGFRIYVKSESEEESKKIAEEIESKIFKAIDLATPLFNLNADDALENGKIIVDNNFNNLYNEYNFFKRQALLKKELTAKKQQYSPRVGRAYFEKYYFEKAVYFTFYSMLEHLCVLFLAFTNVPDRQNVNLFLKKKWSEKFNTVFDLNKPEFNEIYLHLKGLARYRRNPAAHGNTNMAFSFFLEGANHKMSILLHDREMINAWLLEEKNFDVLDSFVRLLNKDAKTKNIFAYIKAGLNVNFCSPSRNDEIANMKKNEIVEYLKFQLRRSDDMANMDW